MSRKEWQQKGQQNRAKARRIGMRTRAFVFGGILAASGGAGLYTEITHYLRATAVTATLLERRKECKVEYQIIGKERTQKPMSCDAAEALQNRVGTNKIKINRTDLVRLRFPVADGGEHEATVDEFNLGSYSQPAGAKLAVAYDPGNPNTVRASLAWDRVKIPLGLIAVGLGILALGFLGPILSVFRWLRGAPPDNDALPTAARPAVKAQATISANEGSVRTPSRPAVVGPRGGQPSCTRRTSFGTR
jgi:hypothetical protein